MYFAAALSLFNALILGLLFKETLVKTQKKNAIRWHHAINIFISAFTHPNITRYSVVLLVMVFGWSNYFSFIPLYLFQTYHYTVMQTSLYLALLGLGFSVGCGYITAWVTRHFQYDKIVIVGLLITASQVLLALVTDEEWVLWVSTFVIGISLSAAYSVLLTIFSNLVGNDEQGWVMGVTGSIMALCFGLTSVFTGLVAYMGAILPMLLAFCGLTLSAVILFFVKGER
jgi:predicted MFS family arabinose efflux permease